MIIKLEIKGSMQNYCNYLNLNISYNNLALSPLNRKLQCINDTQFFIRITYEVMKIRTHTHF